MHSQPKGLVYKHNKNITSKITYNNILLTLASKSQEYNQQLFLTAQSITSSSQYK